MVLIECDLTERDPFALKLHFSTQTSGLNSEDGLDFKWSLQPKLTVYIFVQIVQHQQKCVRALDASVTVWLNPLSNVQVAHRRYCLHPLANILPT